ncbi:MAG: hypothetical protein HS126_18830 [Anaerolineales bacterium]|nr:hypothetical protein [Anaerolineales bacterium]
MSEKLGRFQLRVLGAIIEEIQEYQELGWDKEFGWDSVHLYRIQQRLFGSDREGITYLGGRREVITGEQPTGTASQVASLNRALANLEMRGLIETRGAERFAPTDQGLSEYKSRASTI